MPLFVSSVLRRSFSLRADVSPVYVCVDGKYLSRQYGLTDLATEYWVRGTVVGVWRVYGSLSSAEREVIEKYVVGKGVRLYLVPGILTHYDSLYFDEGSWSVLRDVGIFPDEYRVRLKLLKVVVGAGGEVKEVSLYPYRDIEAPEV